MKQRDSLWWGECGGRVFNKSFALLPKVSLDSVFPVCTYYQEHGSILSHVKKNPLTNGMILYLMSFKLNLLEFNFNLAK